MVNVQRSDYTFKYNHNIGRHGWLRLTPAYSVKLVKEIVNGLPGHSVLFDPFSGTATTGLAAAEKGLSVHCQDINPFLVWFGNAKCRNYSIEDLIELRESNSLFDECISSINEPHWFPNIHNIHRWWNEHTLQNLSALRYVLVKRFGEPVEDAVSSLVWIAFCRLIIETSSASFHHVSMSFRDTVSNFTLEQIERLYMQILQSMLQSVNHSIPGTALVHLGDSRESATHAAVQYSHVITSPPYPNRISYIRELRPYMYWTKFLDEPRAAGDLDWNAIGGTWGVATSRLRDWKANSIELPQSVYRVISQIQETEEMNALLMANYVKKYFHDMHIHFYHLRERLKKGAELWYIVGNSNFYGVQVHTEKLLEESLNMLGFSNVRSFTIRKRNSKKELYEYCIYATWKENRSIKPKRFGIQYNQEPQMVLF